MAVGTTTQESRTMQRIVPGPALEETILYGHHQPRFDGPMDTRDVLGDDRLLLPQNDQE